jgi:uncharacterized protein
MPINLRLPGLPTIALGGFAVGGSIWLLDGMVNQLGDWIPAIVVSSGLVWSYWKLQGTASPSHPTISRPLTIATVTTAVATAEAMVDQLASATTDFASAPSAPLDPQRLVLANQQIANLRLQMRELLGQLDRPDRRLVILGAESVGKTSLKILLDDALPAANIHIQDTAALFVPGVEITPESVWQQAALCVKTADIVIFMVDGDLMASQMLVLQRLVASHRRTLVVFNKQDQYLPKEQTTLLTQIQTRLTEIIPAIDVLPITTQPRPIKVRQVEADGNIQEWLEEPERDIIALTDRLNTILLKESQNLILASSLGQAEALQAEAQGRLNALRRERAMPLIDRAQWLVAGTAFANPFPALDLLATAAINAQLVMGLSQLYQQKMTIDQAKLIATTLATLMLKMGIVEVSSQAVAALLKSNAVTYAAGGLVQGISGAYLTRLAGLTLVGYFEVPALVSQPTTATDRLRQILTHVLQQNPRDTFLPMFVKQATDRLMVDRLVVEQRHLETSERI